MGITIYAVNENLPLLDALASKTRLEIIRLLSVKPMNIKQIADSIGMSMAMATRHIDILADSGIVNCEWLPSSRGRQRLCSLNLDKITIILKAVEQIKKQKSRLLLGDYAKAIDIQAPCGLEDENGIKGIEDDPRYFFIPSRRDLIKYWFSNGVIKYRINKSLEGTKINSVSVRFLMSVQNVSERAKCGSVYFSFCEKIFWHGEFEVGEEPKEYTIVLDNNGVNLNENLVSYQGIDNYKLCLDNFSFEIGAGYYKGNKSVVTLYSTEEISGIELEIMVN